MQADRSSGLLGDCAELGHRTPAPSSYRQGQPIIREERPPGGVFG